MFSSVLLFLFPSDGGGGTGTDDDFIDRNKEITSLLVIQIEAVQ